MNHTLKRFLPFLAIAAISFVLGGLIIPGREDTTSTQSTEESNSSTKWTCSMHPQIVQPSPGDCPICGMDLIPLDSSADGDPGPRAISMSESSKALAAIETTLVKRDFPTAVIPMVGHIDFDETRVKSISARFPARIEELYINFEGVRVEEGDHLAVVYSPELFTAQKELITAEKSSQNILRGVAREKLRLWGLLPDQIDAIAQQGEASDRFELKAPLSGVVISKKVNEGDYVQTGQPLFRIADLNHLWLYLEAYESDLPWLRYGQNLTFTVEAWPGEIFSGRIAFIDSELDRKTRTASIRVNVPNPEGRLKPGMFARGKVEVEVAEQGLINTSSLAGKWISPMHPEVIKDEPGQCDVCGMDLVPAESLGFVSLPEGEAPLVVPTSAVLRTGQRAVVYLELPNTERPTFEGREIVLGPRAGGVFIVKEGLSEGDRVVTKGAFKIDSSLQINAKPSMMNPSEKIENKPAVSADFQVDVAITKEILPSYFSLQQSLANDDLYAAKSALKDMIKITGHFGPLPDLIHEMLNAESLDALRRPHFEMLSDAFIALIKANPDDFEGKVFQMHCPMVYSDRGANWLQSDEDLRNPYYGASMLSCGDLIWHN